METIHKTAPLVGHEPNLRVYDEVRDHFSWQAARAELDGLPGGQGLNIAYEAVDRHAGNPKLCDTAALKIVRKSKSIESYSYRQLKEYSDRFANALQTLGVTKGDVVFSLLGRAPELYISALGTLKNGAIFSPLFSAFGPEPIQTRIKAGQGKVLVTTNSFYQRKVAPIRSELPSLQHVILTDGESITPEIREPDNILSYAALLKNAADKFQIVATTSEDPALLHFTSGTTGRPKGAIHVHEAVVAHHSTGKLALDLRPGDVFWCTADPGWVTGVSYGIIAPLTNGATLLADEAEFDAERWYQILSEQKVNVWYTAPTAIRMLMKAGIALARKWPLPHLRFVASVGEPLNPEAVRWGVEAFGMPIHDNWWQTETGGIMIANYAAMDVKPGSMGKPLPGVEAIIVEPQSDSIKQISTPNVQGELTLRKGWPSMFRGYLNDEKRYSQCFRDGWYLTGDLAKVDEDGYFWFVGRADDVIKSAGHLIGPFEVESALMEHPAVAEAGAIGKPDPVIMETVKAFVSLKSGFPPTEELRQDILGFSRKRLGPAVAPKEIEIIASLPKTKSGKIMRRLLKARELGLAEGDTSTLESS